MTAALTQAQLDHIKGRRVVASISGGKDSCALSQRLNAHGIEHDRIFCDTGWESNETYDYINGPLEKALGTITWVYPPRGMEELILKKGMFPSRVRRFCTQELKTKPIIRYFEERLESNEDCVNAIGIRAGESEARSHMPEWEWCDGFSVETWRPLIGWSEQDVIDTLKHHGVAPNPLYLKGASRVGCWPCIFSRKSEIRFLAKHDPKRIDQIRELEAKVAEAAQLRAQARGETLANPPSLFQARTGGTGDCWPIDRVVQWATQNGQQELFEDPTPGCARWGLCEAHPEKEGKS